MMEEVCGVCEVLETTKTVEGERAKECQFSTYGEALKRLLRFVQELPDDFKGEKKLLYVSRLLVVCAGHCGPHYWTNASNRQLANELVLAISTLCGYSDVCALLRGKDTLVLAIFDHFKLVLTKDKWKDYPVHKQALIWIIKHIKHPHLAPHLGSILPPTLWMLDDHLDYHRIQALSIITHIIQQMDPTELQWHGRVELMFEAMKPLLYVSSSEVICTLHSCLLNLLPVLDYSPQPPSIPAKPKTTDEVFSTLISALAKESKIALQRAYVAQLKGYIMQLGLFSVRHIKKLLPLLLLGLEHSDPAKELLRIHSLQSLSALICCTWARAPTYKLTVVKSLSKLVVDLQTADDYNLLDLVVECLHVLLAACPELKSEYELLCESCQHETMQSCLQQALQTVPNQP